VENEKPKLLNVTINGQAVQVTPGTSVFQAAEKAGVYVPHYCYHPDLPVAGVCRMCMVDIEKNPRLQVSCNTAVSEGMVVSTNSPRVKEAVKGVLELHLINHPLDCPICDKAGECKLQDIYSGFGLYKSRMEFEKVHKPKVVDIGTIMLDSERCILCTRCVRFTSDVTKTNELGIFNRGDRSELRTYDEKPLRNHYTGNLADICPVGALTAKDFRFQCRVWFLEKTPSVCTMCARGCNTMVSVNPATKQLYRVEPRRNPEVNKSWICDTGRWGYHYVYDKSRINVPIHRTATGSEEISWHQAFGDLHQILSTQSNRVGVALSPQLTSEETLDLVDALSQFGVSNFTWLVNEAVVNETEPYDGVLRHRDATPNAKGVKSVCELAGQELKSLSTFTALFGEGKLDWCFVFGIENFVDERVGQFLKDLPTTTQLVFHATNDSELFDRVAYLLPNTSAFEKNGTLINALGKIQKLKSALRPQFTARDGLAVAHGLRRGDDRSVTEPLRGSELFKEKIEKRFAEEFHAEA
jgi:NADH-quinone oxidoreductase subunit G